MHADTAQAGARTTGLFGRLTDLGYTTGVFGKVTNDQTRILPQLVKEGSASYIDSPVDYNSYDGLPYFRCAALHSLWQRLAPHDWVLHFAFIVRVHTGGGWVLSCTFASWSGLAHPFLTWGLDSLRTGRRIRRSSTRTRRSLGRRTRQPRSEIGAWPGFDRSPTGQSLSLHTWAPMLRSESPSLSQFACRRFQRCGVTAVKLRCSLTRAL
jgi:hypothetical protein